MTTTHSHPRHHLQEQVRYLCEQPVLNPYSPDAKPFPPPTVPREVLVAEQIRGVGCRVGDVVGAGARGALNVFWVK